MLARWREALKKSRLMLVVLASFVIGYCGIAYYLFYKGLQYLHGFPLIGGLISQRLLFLIYGFFFIMLMFSNIIIGYSTLFKNRETQWFLTLPLEHEQIFRYKLLETLVVSSWALVILSAPLMAAYGQVYEVQWHFYLKTALAYIPFVVLPAVIGSALVLIIVRLLTHRHAKNVAFALGFAALIAIMVMIKPFDENASGPADQISFDDILKHTKIGLNPFLPSAWMARAIVAWRESFGMEGEFYLALLFANAMFGLLLVFSTASRYFFSSWAMAVSSRAERFQRELEIKRNHARGQTFLEWSVAKLIFWSRADAALILKDIRLFWRDPAQWIQFMVFFGLLSIYVLNLRNVSFNFNSPFWETLISYLNLLASALTLSTLTTRFVFPQFSLEGRRIWILELAPSGLGRVVIQKLLFSVFATGSVTTLLMIVSSTLLKLPTSRVAFFAFAILLMAISLSGISVGVGALFPNFREDNPSKIVSGFGGTLCLVVSFIYIILFVTMVALPEMSKVSKVPFYASPLLCYGAAVVLSLLSVTIPLILALQRVKNLEE